MDRLIEGARQLGLDLTPRQVEQFQLYYEELMNWNRKMNLTAITDYEGVQVRHFLDSLTVILALDKGQPISSRQSRVVDVGTGAGLPGIPLKILLPSIDLVLVESVNKKAIFLHHLVQHLALERVHVITARAETIGRQADYRERFDVVLSRAVGKLPAVVELALPLCRVRGIFVAQKKEKIDEELEQANAAITKLGGRINTVERVNLPAFAKEKERLLVIIEKVQPTPERYPRRPGVPARHPLR